MRREPVESLDSWLCVSPSHALQRTRPTVSYVLLRFDSVAIGAEQSGQLDPQSLVVQSVGVLIGSPSFIAGKLPWSFGGKAAAWVSFIPSCHSISRSWSICVTLGLPYRHGWCQAATYHPVRYGVCALNCPLITQKSSRHPSINGKSWFRGFETLNHEPWTLLNVDDFNGDEDAPHSIWFEKRWPCLILRIAKALSCNCGPLVIIPDTGCAPVIVSSTDNVDGLLSTWEHTSA
jgi:hypothetical protein